MANRVVVIGAGGHARVLIDALLACGIPVYAIAETDSKLIGQSVLGVRIQSEMEALRSSDGILRLVNGIGSVGSLRARRSIFERFKSQGHTFLQVIHPSALIGSNVELQEGVQVMAGAVLQAGTRVMENSIINTGAIIDHDCLIGKHVHVAPGVVVSGGVQIGEDCHVGTGAVLVQQVVIGRASLVAAGACVVNNVAEDSRVKGVPAKEFGRDDQ